VAEHAASEATKEGIMSLFVDSIKVVEESDELGDDDVYIVIFRGECVPPFASNVGVIGPGPHWTNMSTDDFRGADVGLAAATPNSVYAVMLVDEDSSRDISGDAVIGAWRAQTALVWKSVMLGRVAGKLPTSNEAGRAAGFAAIQSTMQGLSSLYMEFPKGDDDVLGVKRVTITAPGSTQKIRFRSNAEDATYDVTFKQK
jgi:hypothetical protein